MDDEFMLTTLDNPFNPFTHYDEWFSFDTSHGYHTCAYLARIVKSSDELSDADQDLSIDQAMDDIIKLNILCIYIKVQKNYKPNVVVIEN